MLSPTDQGEPLDFVALAARPRRSDFDDLSAIPSPLSEDIQKQLLRAYKDTGSQEAFDLIVDTNRALVYSIAARYRGRGISLPDLVAAGELALVNAARNFDPDKYAPTEERPRSRFSSYARTFVHWAVVHEFAAQSWRRRTMSSIEKRLETDPHWIDKMEHQEDHADSSVSRMTASSVADIVPRLKPMEQRVVDLHYGLSGEKPLNLNEIGLVVGLSRERVRQVRNAALESLRKMSSEDLLLDAA